MVRAPSPHGRQLRAVKNPNVPPRNQADPLLVSRPLDGGGGRTPAQLLPLPPAGRPPVGPAKPDGSTRPHRAAHPVHLGARSRSPASSDHPVAPSSRAVAPAGGATREPVSPPNGASSHGQPRDSGPTMSRRIAPRRLAGTGFRTRLTRDDDFPTPMTIVPCRFGQSERQGWLETPQAVHLSRRFVNRRVGDSVDPVGNTGSGSWLLC
jgi:hypothetical protein